MPRIGRLSPTALMTRPSGARRRDGAPVAGRFSPAPGAGFRGPAPACVGHRGPAPVPRGERLVCGGAS
jgi:hypothetical protein